MSGKKRILIVDDEPSLRRILEASFEKHGWATGSAECAEAALTLLEREPFDVVLTDVTMPGMSGTELLSRIRGRWPELPVIVMTAYGTIPQAVQAIRDGAFEYVTKPFDLDRLRKVAQAALSERKGRKATSRSAPPLADEPALIAESPEMKRVLEIVDRVADSRATALITGESGTGKEVVAKRLHRLSPRREHPFVAVSCAALPETLLESELFGYEKGAFTGAETAKPGRFEVADGGTLFLDEIGEIPLSTQVKLLRVLQEREFERLGSNRPVRVDTRVIAATNRNLQRAVDEGRFRLDLLYRLQVVEIHLPPLRERPGDILPLARHFLARQSALNDRRLTEIAPDAERALLAYAWPGNVRELENVIERAVVLADRNAIAMTAADLPPHLLRAA